MESKKAAFSANCAAKARNTALATLIVAFVLSAFFGFYTLIPKKVYAKTAVTTLSGETFTQTQEGSSTVYTATEMTDEQKLIPADNKFGDVNVCNFEVKPNEYITSQESSLGLMIDVNDGLDTKFYFEIVPYWRAVRLRLYQNGKLVGDLDEAKNYSAQNTEYLKIKCVALKNKVSITVNDEVTLASDSRGYGFDKSTFYFRCWSSAPSFKNVELDKENIVVPMMSGNTVFEAKEGDETVYTVAQNSNLNYMYYAHTTSTNNMITFGLRYNAYGGEYGEGLDERNLQLYINTQVAGVQLAFQFLPRWKAVRITMLNNGSVTAKFAETNYKTPDGYTSTDWLTFSCAFMQGYAYIKCGDTTVAEAVLDETYTFENQDISFTCWNVAPSFKNIELSKGGVLPPAKWTGSTYTEANGVYTAVEDNNLKQLACSRNTGGANAISFRVKPNGYQPESDGNAGFIVYANSPSSAYLFFELMPKTGTARIRIIDGSGAIVIGQSGYEGSYDEWIDVKCIFDTDFVAMSVNGKVLISAFDTSGYTFNKTKCCMSAWKTAPSFSEMTFSEEEKNYAEMGYMDLDFEDLRGVSAVSAVNAKVAYDEASKCVGFTVEGKNPTVSVLVTQLPGGRYSALLPVRNTVMLRLKNKTDANALVLKAYGEDVYEKQFEIEQSEDYQTYYLNISDKNPQGYLEKLELTFNGAESGDFSIQAISFEREDVIETFASTEAPSCVADLEKQTVTVSGKVAQKYAGKKVYVVESAVKDYKETLTGETVATATASSDGSFSLTFSLKGKNGALTQLSTRFLAYVQDGGKNIKLSHAFAIENYYDFYENPYKANVPNTVTVKVTDSKFGAKGDGYTDDTAAIQKAIDYVAELGGGKVVVPGEGDMYGRRYIATNIVLKSNIELNIEEGAVIWQSSRKSDYKYEPTYGHDVAGDAMWSHAGVCANYPLIQITGCENVRVTGGGQLRMMDDGNEWLDGSNAYVGWANTDIIVGCKNRIHLTPIGLFNSKYVEISDIEIIRGGSWHVVSISCSKLYIANVRISEAVCLNTDGFSLQNTSEVMLLRNTLVSNDDAIVLLPCYRDNRDRTDFWWGRIDGESDCVSDITVVGNNLFGGCGLTFIPWGSENPDLSQTEIKDIEVFDNVINGIGSWADNPNYGFSAGASYSGLSDHPETDDYSPIKDIHIYNNVIGPSFIGLAVGTNSQYLSATATNFVNDAGIVGTDKFLNASFERELRYDNEVDFVSGLAYWSYVEENGGKVGYEKVGDKQKTAKYSENAFTVADYAGYLKGNAKIYQGIYFERGWYRVKANVKNANGNAKWFVGNTYVKNGNTYDKLQVTQSQTIKLSEEFESSSYAFYVDKAGVYAVGILCGGGDEVVYFDDFALGTNVTTEEKAAATADLRAELSAKIDEAKTLRDSGNYTGSTVETLSAAIKEAERVLKAQATLPNVLKNNVDDLNSAISGLVEKPADDKKDDDKKDDNKNDSSSGSNSGSSSTSNPTNSGCRGGTSAAVGAVFLELMLFVIRKKRG